MAVDFKKMLAAAREKDLAGLKNLAGEAAGEAREGILAARSKLHAGCNTAAEKVAAKVTEKTGRETTADEVKKAAVVASVAVVGAAALANIAAAQSGGAGITGLAASSPGSWTEPGVGHGDVMDEAYKFFARNGSSLNITTHTVDMDGCFLD